MMIDWTRIETVLLDMDGTLLDLHYDNHFWSEYVPLHYAKRHAVDLETARTVMADHYERVAGTMNWYCIDYWTEQLDLDIATLKEEVKHLIAVHPDVPEFLDAVRASGRRVVMVTNAHGKSLALKMRKTSLGDRFDAIICSHDLGLPKEEIAFWDRLKDVEPFACDTALLVDDSLPVLRSAARYGIGQLLAVRNPDSRQPPREDAEFTAIDGFAQLLPIPPGMR